MIKLKTIIIFQLAVFTIFSCGNKTSKPEENQETEATTNETEATSNETEEETSANENPSYDPKRGEGKFSAETVQLGEKLDAAMAASGEKVSGVKCTSCHKTTEEKLVGPGWKGVTTRRKPEWIMNFITNPDPMIEKDPEIQAQLELCLVRMPNQGLDDKEAREILEFMRKNDNVK